VNIRSQSVRIETGDTDGLRKLIEYFLRCPFSQAPPAYGTTACIGALGWLSGPPVLKPVTVTLTVAPAVRPVNIASDSSASFSASLVPAASQLQDT